VPLFCFLHPRQPLFHDQGWKDPRSGHCWGWLRYLTASGGCLQRWGPRSFRAGLARAVILPLLLRFSCPHRADELEALSGRLELNGRQRVPWSMLWDNDREVEKVLGPLRSKLLRAGNLNLRRVPRFAAGADVAARLGLGAGPEGSPLVEHTHSLLWMGASRGGVHTDNQDNVLMQLTGDVEVLVIPAGCVGLAKVPGATRDVAGWLRAGQPPNSSRLPFYHIHLRQGEGLVLPSLAQHKVVSSEGRRVGLNAFFEPRFGRMQWPGAPANYFLRHRRDILALRSLHVMAARRLWDTRRLPYVMHTERIELL